jgi:hypothetical protein
MRSSGFEVWNCDMCVMLILGNRNGYFRACAKLRDVCPRGFEREERSSDMKVSFSTSRRSYICGHVYVESGFRSEWYREHQSGTA